MANRKLKATPRILTRFGEQRKKIASKTYVQELCILCMNCRPKKRLGRPKKRCHHFPSFFRMYHFFEISQIGENLDEYRQEEEISKLFNHCSAAQSYAFFAPDCEVYPSTRAHMVTKLQPDPDRCNSEVMQVKYVAKRNACRVIRSWFEELLHF